MNEWFSDKKGYEVGLFEIVDEGECLHGHQYNMVFGEGIKHGSNDVASMLYLLCTSMKPVLGNAKVV